MGTAFNANEFKTVDDLYSKGLGRQGDQGGLDYWKSQFGDSIDANEFNQFKASAMPEYNANQAANAPASKYATLDDLYKGVLGRSADQTGSEYWKSQFGDVIDSSEEAQFMKSAQAEIDAKTQAENSAKTKSITDPYGANPMADSTDPYVIAAQQNAIANQAAAERATAANRVDQNTPYGNVDYRQTGVDANGNPIWEANQTLAPGFQKPLENIQNNIATVNEKPFDVSGTQNQMSSAQNPNFAQIGNSPQLQTQVAGAGMEGWDKANELLMSRLRPQMEQRDAALDAKLANQGIMPGTEAYNRAKLTANQANNDLMTQAQLAGSQVQNQQFNQNLAGGQFTNQALTGQNTMTLANLGFNNGTQQQNFANSLANTQLNNSALQNNYNQNLTAYNNPLQQLNAFRQGTNPNYVGVANQQGVAGPDYFGALNSSNNNQIAIQNQNTAQSSRFLNTLAGLGSSALLGGGGVSGLGSAAKSAYDWLTGQAGNSAINNMSSDDIMKFIGAYSDGTFDPAMSSSDYLTDLYGLDIF